MPGFMDNSVSLHVSSVVCHVFFYVASIGMTEADLKFPSKHQRVMKMSLLSGVIPHLTSKSFHNCSHIILTSKSHAH